MSYEVVVSNTGIVYFSGSKRDAVKKYVEYVRQSIMGSGRAAHKAVTLHSDGDLLAEHLGRRPGE